MKTGTRDRDNGRMSDTDLDRLRELLCRLQDHIQSVVTRARRQHTSEELSGVVARTEADVLYRIDRVGEDGITRWFREHWPDEWPVEIVMEGLDPSRRLIFPEARADSEPLLKCIIDPTDGTRGLMVDKRSAWILAGIAPNRGEANRLLDIEVAVMTELPPTKQNLADQVSGIRGRGREGIVAERINVDSRARRSIPITPSKAIDLHGGFASTARFFPQAKVLLSRFDEALLTQLYGKAAHGELEIFEDQYICSGGQFYELLMGRDRMICDLRPLAFEMLGLPRATAAHPYDVCTELILREAGCPVTDVWGALLDGPMDTTTPIAWVGYANPTLQSHVTPAFEAALRLTFDSASGAEGNRGVKAQ